MSINCGAGLWKRAASFFDRIKEVFCFNCEYPLDLNQRNSRQGCEKQ